MYKTGKFKGLAKILAQAGIRVVIGVLGRDQPAFEAHQHGFYIRRMPAAPGAAVAFKRSVYLPIYRKLPIGGQRVARVLYQSNDG